MEATADAGLRVLQSDGLALHVDEDAPFWTGFNGSIPGFMGDGLQRYIRYGIRPGSFLKAVLSNDLLGAFTSGVQVNIGALPAYLEFLMTQAPAACWGSAAQVEAWAAAGGQTGLMARGVAV